MCEEQGATRAWTRARNWWYLGAMGKPYQVRQVRDVILRYSLRLGE